MERAEDFAETEKKKRTTLVYHHQQLPKKNSEQCLTIPSEIYDTGDF